MIKSFQHKGLERFFYTGNKAGIQPKHAAILNSLLGYLDAAASPEDMNLPGLDFHKLAGNLKGFYSVKVNANWRLIFQFEGENALLVDYTDYH